MELLDDLTLDGVQFASLGLGGSIVTALAAMLASRAAGGIGLVSRHRRDRFGSARIPLSGGVGLFAGIVALLLVLRVVPSPALAVAAGGFFLLGLADDILELRPPAKLLLQAALACTAALLASGSALHIGLYVLVYLVVVNASNYLDNMDGLLAGVALTQAFALLFFSMRAGAAPALLVWALPGILWLTLPPARLYLGDSGSHLVGGLLAHECVRLLSGSPGGFQPRLLLPLVLCLAVPLVDAAIVTVSRLRRRRPVFRGGTDHLSHRLVRRGLSVPGAVLVLVLASAVCGISSLLLLRVS